MYFTKFDIMLTFLICIIVAHFYTKKCADKKYDKPHQCESFSRTRYNKHKQSQPCKIKKHNYAENYIYDNVIDTRPKFTCNVDKTTATFSRSDVEKYREQQIEFRDKLYGSSSPPVDPVDKMNNFSCPTGRRIYDVYNEIIAT